MDLVWVSWEKAAGGEQEPIWFMALDERVLLCLRWSKGPIVLAEHRADLWHFLFDWVLLIYSCRLTVFRELFLFCLSGQEVNENIGLTNITRSFSFDRKNSLCQVGNMLLRIWRIFICQKPAKIRRISTNREEIQDGANQRSFCLMSTRVRSW